MGVAKTAVRKKKSKPYVMEVDEKTGSLYLKRERPPFIGELPYVTALVLTVLFALLSCCRYIQVRTDVECRIRQTAELERRYLELKNSNTMMERQVNQTPDLNQVYEIAVGELGMIPANQEHVRVFERTNSEFVYQIDNIPNIGF